jgi:hypothetical protein
MADLFETLKRLLVPYAKHFRVMYDDADHFELVEELPHYRTLFASVNRGRGGIGLCIYALKYFPELAFPPSLAAKQLKSYPTVIRLTAITAAQTRSLATVLAKAWKRIAAGRKTDPTKPYFALASRSTRRRGG